METLQRWWLKKMMSSRHGVREKLTLFWHDHFAVSQLDIGSATSKTTTDRMRNHIRTLRLFGAGNFRDLILEVTRDQAMLRFLDNGINTVTNPNENYGREVMELYTLGVFDLKGFPNYTQDDGVDMSRALTGFDNGGNFRIARHDPGTKTLFAGRPFEVTGNLGVVEPGDGFAQPQEQVPLPPERNVIDLLLTHRDSDARPTTARYL